MGDCDCDCDGDCDCDCPSCEIGNCKSHQCARCRECCRQDAPVQCCDCLANTWKEQCPSGRVYDCCQKADCPNCCADCARCSACDLCTGYYCHCDCNCDGDGHWETARWGLFEQRGFRIGRLADCEHEQFCGEVPWLEVACAWTACWLCTLTSLLAHSRNPILMPFKRPHCGHCITAAVACPCSICIIRDNLRRRHHGNMRVSHAQVRDAWACLCCYPCMVAQFSRATFPWEWSPFQPVPAELQWMAGLGVSGGGGANPAPTVGTVVADRGGDAWTPAAPRGREGAADDVPDVEALSDHGDLMAFESVEINEGGQSSGVLRGSHRSATPAREASCAQMAIPTVPGTIV